MCILIYLLICLEYLIINELTVILLFHILFSCLTVLAIMKEKEGSHFEKLIHDICFIDALGKDK